MAVLVPVPLSVASVNLLLDQAVRSMRTSEYSIGPQSAKLRVYAAIVSVSAAPRRVVASAVLLGF